MLTFLAPIMPEVLLASFALLVLLFSTAKETLLNFRTIRLFGIIGICSVIFLLVGGQQTEGLFFNNLFANTPLTLYTKILAAIASAITIMYLTNTLRQTNSLKGEGIVLFLIATLGIFLLISARHFLLFYLALELMSFCLYIMTASNQTNLKSSEAGLKYFLLGGLASSILLYGLSLLYGLAGDLSFAAVRSALEGGTPMLALTGSFFVIVGMLFKLSIVPFHMWTPDVYEGAPTPVTAYMATLGKIAAAVVLMVLLSDVFAPLQAQFQPVLGALAALTMLLGAFVAILQKSIKRLLAYSSITHVGFILAALMVATPAAGAATLFYITIYTLTTLGIFGVLLLARYRGQYLENLEDLKGLAKTSPILAGSLLVFMFSLAGVPPFAGFFAKLSIFNTLLQAGQFWLVLVGVAASIVALFYSLNIVKIMYFDTPKRPLQLDPLDNNPIMTTTVCGLALLTLYFGLFPDDIMAIVKAAL